MTREHYVVFGAHEKADKCLVCGFDKTGTLTVKICDLAEPIEWGETPITANIDGEYTTLYFSRRNGKKALRQMIRTLAEVLAKWESLDGKET